MRKSRFSQNFPILAKILASKGFLIFTCLITSAYGGLYSPHLSLSIIIFLYVLLSYHLELRQLNTLLLTPLTVLSLYSFLGLGIGSVLMVIGNDGEFDPNLFIMQGSYLLAFPFMMIIYPVLNRRLPSFSLPDPAAANSESFYKPLRLIGYLFFIYAFFSLITGVFTGAADRGEAGQFIVENKFGIWTIFTIFSRFSNLSFVLVPLLIRDSHRLQKYIIYFLLSVYLILCFAIGSRGAVLWPVLHMFAGYWMFGGSAKVLKRAFIILIAVAFFLIPFMDAYRNTNAFKTSALSNPIERLQSLTETNELLNDPDRRSNIWITGRALVGASDMIIYENTPSVVPHAEWENIDAILYIWIPKIIAPWKPFLIDGNEIVISYTGKRNERSSANISFNADMYRRFGWTGVLISYLIFAAFYSFVISCVFFVYFTRNALFGFLLILLSLGFLMNVPNSTLLTTFWIWLWDIPKYVLGLIVIYKFAIFQSKIQNVFPAIHYLKESVQFVK